MKEPVYKLMDEKGRVLIPKELRQKAEMEGGDIIKLSVCGGKLTAVKVDIERSGARTRRR